MIDEIIKIEEALEVLGVKKRLDNAEKQIWTPSGVRTVNGEEPDDRGDITVPTQYTDEMAQDAVGNALGTGLAYNGETGAISVDETELRYLKFTYFT